MAALPVPVTRYRPSGVNARLSARPYSGIAPDRARLDRFHNSTRPVLTLVLVEMPAATVVPSRLIARLVTCGS